MKSSPSTPELSTDVWPRVEVSRVTAPSGPTCQLFAWLCPGPSFAKLLGDWASAWQWRCIHGPEGPGELWGRSLPAPQEDCPGWRRLVGADKGFEGSPPRSAIYCIFIVQMSPSERRGRVTREGAWPSRPAEDLAQAPVGRAPHQGKPKGTGQLRPAFFQ